MTRRCEANRRPRVEGHCREDERGRAIERTLLSVAALLGLLAIVLAPGTVARAGTTDTVVLVGTLDENGEVVGIAGNRGESTVLEFFYTEPIENIQGFSLALALDCAVEGVPGSFSVEGTIVEALGFEFISQSFDNDPGDGDGCEIVLGLLLDAVAPFDSQTLPQTVLPIRFGHIELFVPADVPCFTSYGVSFENGLDGGSGIPIFNTVVVDNQSLTPAGLEGSEVAVPADFLFVRGDVNDDTVVNLADVIYGVNYLFLEGPEPLCLDPLDTDDNGTIELADVLTLVGYLFLGGAPPATPFPGCGLEAPQDRDGLDCEEPTAGCPFCG